MTEQTADSAAQRVIDADLHLEKADYREGLRQFPIMTTLRWLAAFLVVLVAVLIVVSGGFAETRYLVPTVWLPFLVLGVGAWLFPDLLAWGIQRTSPFRDGGTVHLDAEQIAYTGQEASVSYSWPLVKRAIETESAFHLLVGAGLSTAVCTFPKRAFPLEDHAAIRDLITTKVGKIHRR